MSHDNNIWVYSVPVDVNREVPSNSFTTLPIRRHKENHISETSVHRFNQDWSEIVGDGQHTHYGRTNSPAGTFNSLVFPESLPGRVDVASYLNELAFIHDDITEDESYRSAVEEHESLISAMDTTTSAARLEGSRASAMKSLVAKVLLESEDIDRIAAMEMIDGFKKVWLVEMESAATKTVSNIDEYMAYRHLNAGVKGFWGMMMFCYGDLFTMEDLERIPDIVDAAERAMAFTNDYFSWEKERNSSTGRVMNLVHFLMTSDGISEREAMEKTKNMILEHERRYVTLRDEYYRMNPTISHKLRRLVEYIGAAVAGVHYWHAQAPRYKVHTSAAPSQRNGDVDISVKGKQDANSIVSAGRENSQFTSIGEVLRTRGAAHESRSQHKQPPLPVPTATLDSTALLGPILYIESLPSKNIRSLLFDAVNTWFKVPAQRLNVFKKIIDDLHNSSLILDDIQDESTLRRGNTATHLVFGTGNSINSAVYMFSRACRTLSTLNDPVLFMSLLEELEALFIGQSWDLTWKTTMECPTESQYLAMVEGKTGAMFKLLFRLMHSSAPGLCGNDFNQLSQRLGLLFQIRDDYMNLQSREYSKQKGFCEDLDDGKLSYLIVKCCALDRMARNIILGIFRQNQHRSIPVESKMQIIKLMERTGVLSHTRDIIQQLSLEIEGLIDSIEYMTNQSNPMLRLLVKNLATIPKPVGCAM